MFTFIKSIWVFNMDLLFLNKDFNICNIVDTFENLAWNRKYFDVGNFSIELILDTYKLLQQNYVKYLYCKDFKELAKIETLENNSTNTKNTVILTGRFLENLLEDRVITTTQNYRGTTEQIARNIVNDFCINCSYPIPKLQLGEYKGLGSNQVYQITGKDVKTILYELLKMDGLSYSIDYDYEKNILVFNVWSGLNRTESQTNNSWATFCKNFENIQNDKYSIDETQYKNVVFVAGEGTAGDRIVVEVNRAKDIEERKELYVDARDLQQSDDMTSAEYKSLLYQRGLEKLQENNRVEVTEFEVDSNSNLEYKKDYDLGDIVTYKNDNLDLYVENRIVEISEIFEGQDKKINIVFGDDYNIKKVGI